MEHLLDDQFGGFSTRPASDKLLYQYHVLHSCAVLIRNKNWPASKCNTNTLPARNPASNDNLLFTSIRITGSIEKKKKRKNLN